MVVAVAACQGRNGVPMFSRFLLTSVAALILLVAVAIDGRSPLPWSPAAATYAGCGVTQDGTRGGETLKGTGGHVRLVMLPFESHGYTAMESTEHVLWEMLSWFDHYLKNAAPRAKETVQR